MSMDTLVTGRPVGFTHAAVTCCAPVWPSGYYLPFLFSAVFNQLCGHSDWKEFSSWFYSCCQTIVDSAAPFKNQTAKAKPDPWFNDSCCQEEMSQSTAQIGKIKLQVSFYILKDCRCHYCNAIKKPKKKYFANVISSKGHNSHVSFNTTDSVLNAPQHVCLSFSWYMQ